MGLTPLSQLEMEEYDLLPVEVREVLRRADHLWSALDVRGLWLVQQAAGQSAADFAKWLELRMKLAG